MMSLDLDLELTVFTIIACIIIDASSNMHAIVATHVYLTSTWYLTIRQLAKRHRKFSSVPDTRVKLADNHYGGDECCMRAPVYKDVWRPLII